MNRRDFTKLTLGGSALLGISPLWAMKNNETNKPVRIGAPVFEKYDSPDAWAAIHKKAGFGAAYCPVSIDDPQDVVAAYGKAAKDNDIVIAEVGSWVNMLASDEDERKKNIDICKRSLALADEIGALCSVDISGSRNPNHWAGPSPKNLTKETFDMVVEVSRDIIDSVKPKRSFFTIETMPWMYPDSVDSCLELIRAMDRKQFGIHFDPVNLITSPGTFYGIDDIIRDAFKRLGSHIISCHAKDLTINEEVYVPQFSECLIGTGIMNYKVFLTELSKHGQAPLMLEHLETAEEYAKAEAQVRKAGAEAGIVIE